MIHDLQSFARTLSLKHAIWRSLEHGPEQTAVNIEIVQDKDCRLTLGAIEFAGEVRRA